MAVFLTHENYAARPIGYAVKRSLSTTYAARTMMVSGILLMVYLVYHLLHFTFGVTHPSLAHLTDSLGRHDVYAMVVQSFRDPYLAVGYVAAMVVLCAHLSHGVGSFLQSLGLNDEYWLPRLERFGRLLGFALAVGYSIIPLSILFGFIRLIR